MVEEEFPRSVRSLNSSDRKIPTGAQDTLAAMLGVTLVHGPEHRVRLSRLQHLAEQTDRFQLGRRAERTRKAFASDWGDFERWCAEMGLPALSSEPETVALYITELAERRCKRSSAAWWRSPPTTRTSILIRRRATASCAAPRLAFGAACRPRRHPKTRSALSTRGGHSSRSRPTRSSGSAIVHYSRSASPAPCAARSWWRSIARRRTIRTRTGRARVVQDKEQLAHPQSADQRVELGSITLWTDAQGCQNRPRHSRIVDDWGEVYKARAVREVRLDSLRDFEPQSRLTDTSGAGQGEEARLEQFVRDLGDLTLAADETG